MSEFTKIVFVVCVLFGAANIAGYAATKRPYSLFVGIANLMLAFGLLGRF